MGGPLRQDGWRIDVANMVGRRGGDDHAAAVVAEARRTMEQAGHEALLIAEHSHDAARDLAGGSWHGTMNYAGFTLPVWAWLRDPAIELPLLGLPVPVPRLPGPEAMATMRAHAAVTPWLPWAQSWNPLCSHDTARIRSVVADPDLVEVAAGLMVTLPGVPMIFAGDEIGMVGTWGEDARLPFPWAHEDRWDDATLARYQALLALRHGHRALREGGHRWVHLGADVIVFLRECRRERLLVLAARAPADPVVLPARPLGLTVGAAAALYGGADDLPSHPDLVALPADGPTIQVWRLP